LNGGQNETVFDSVFASFTILSCVQGFEWNESDPIQFILLECRHPDGPTQEDDLIAFAQAKGLSNAEMSAKLVALIDLGLQGDTDALLRQLTYSALGGLAYFGGAEERAFVQNIFRTTQDPTLRHIAVRVGIRMMPAQWEEWVREAATDSRFDSLTRYDAYEEAYRIGKSGDERTRQRVEQVLSELEKTEPNPGNRMDMRHWSEKLKAP